MRISDWSSDVCSSDLTCGVARGADRIGRGPPRMTPLPPGSTIGILGAGQLGRMIAVAAAQLGYRCHIFAPSPGPGCDVARTFTAAAWDDLDAVDAFAAAVDVVTYEFENVALAVVDRLAASVPVRPGQRSLEISRDRVNAKTCARALGGRNAPLAGAEEKQTETPFNN